MSLAVSSALTQSAVGIGRIRRIFMNLSSSCLKRPCTRHSESKVPSARCAGGPRRERLHQRRLVQRRAPRRPSLLGQRARPEVELREAEAPAFGQLHRVEQHLLLLAPRAGGAPSGRSGCAAQPRSSSVRRRRAAAPRLPAATGTDCAADAAAAASRSSFSFARASLAASARWRLIELSQLHPPDLLSARAGTSCRGWTLTSRFCP